MTPRQARTERRAAERKVKKAEMRRNKQVALELDDDLPLEEEFSPEELARGRAAAARIDREVALKMADRRATANQPPDQNPDCKGGAKDLGSFRNRPFRPSSRSSFARFR